MAETIAHTFLRYFCSRRKRTPVGLGEIDELSRLFGIIEEVIFAKEAIGC
jgi:hypothetical protein